LANKRNLKFPSGWSLSTTAFCLVTTLACSIALRPSVLMAMSSNKSLRVSSSSVGHVATEQKEFQVPPRSEAAQEQRDEKTPLDKDKLEWESDKLTGKLQDYLFISPETFSCSITFTGKAGKQGVLDFCGEKVTYSGDLEIDESAKLLFDHLMKYIAACNSLTKEQREE